MSHRFRDLAVVSVFAVIALIIVGTGLNQDPRFAIFGLMLTLVLPGYALSAALLLDLRREERMLFTLGFSLVLDVLGGLVLNVTFWGLTPTSWAVWLGGITLASNLYAVARRRSMQKSTTRIPLALVTPKLDKRSIGGLALSVAILLGAGTVALTGAQQSVERFTQLWAVPTVSAESDALQIGIRNQENESARYSLIVISSGQRIGEWQNIELETGRTWTTNLYLAAAPVSTIQVFLYRSEDPNNPYRSVQISPAAWQAS